MKIRCKFGLHKYSEIERSFPMRPTAKCDYCFKTQYLSLKQFIKLIAKGVKLIELNAVVNTRNRV